VDFADVAGTRIDNSMEAAVFLKDALGTTFGCFEEQLDEALGPGLLSAPLIAGLSWLLTGLQTALNGFGAAADTILNPDGFQIVIRQPVAVPKDKSSLHSRESLPGETACGTVTLAELAPHALFVTGVSCSEAPMLLNSTVHGLGSEVGWACRGSASKVILCTPGRSVTTDPERFVSGTHIRALPASRWPAYPGEARQGDRGSVVRVWQDILIKADVISDIPANHDGYYGPRMADAVLSLQRSWGWKNADGVAGRATYDRITR
jgi:hypothetical protein